MHKKDLVSLLHAQLVINMMTSIFKFKPEHVITFQGRKRWCKIRKNRVRAIEVE
jgi:hypothetical protein